MPNAGIDTPSRVRRPRRPNAAEHTLLGLIAISRCTDRSDDAGVHGYDLARRLTDGALADIIRLEPGMLYHYLKKLDAAGLITTSVEHQTSRPDRQVHTLTADGRAVLMNWIVEPVRATREIRLDFLLKLYFAQRLEPASAGTLIEAQQGVVRQLVTSLERQLEQLPDQSPDDAFARTVLALRLSQTRAVLDWLNTLA